MNNIDQNVDTEKTYLDYLKNKYKPFLDFVNDIDENIYKISSYDTIYACPYLPHNLKDKIKSVEGLYPCNTRESTLLSGAYFLEFNDFDEKEYENIKDTLYKFAKFHNCYEELKEIEEIFLKEGWGPDCKDPRFRNIKNKKNKKQQKKAHFEIRNHEDVEDFVSYIKENRSNLKFENLKSICRDLLNICHESKLHLDDETTDFIMKKAGMGKYSPEEVISYLNDLKWTVDKEFITDKKKIKKTIMEGIDLLTEKFKNNDLDEEVLTKYASFVEDIIQKLKLNITYPEDIFFNYTQNKLQKSSDEFLYNDAVDLYYDKKELRNLDPYLLKQHMGDLFFDKVKLRDNKISIEKLANHFKTLDKETKIKFHEFLTLPTLTKYPF